MTLPQVGQANRIMGRTFAGQLRRSTEHEAAPQAPANGQTRTAPGPTPLAGAWSKALLLIFMSLAAQVSGFCGSGVDARKQIVIGDPLRPRFVTTGLLQIGLRVTGK